MDIPKVTRTGPLKGWADRILTGREKHAAAAAPESPRPERPQAPAAPEPSPVPSPPRRENYLGDAFVISGELSGSQDVTIDSRVEGKISLPNQTLRVGPKARIQADIQAANIIIVGSVVGDVFAQDRVEIKPAGSVEGDIRSSRILIADGARLKGSVEMVKPAAEAPAPKPAAPAPKPAAPATKRAATPQSNPPKPPPLPKLSL